MSLKSSSMSRLLRGGLRIFDRLPHGKDAVGDHRPILCATHLFLAGMIALTPPQLLAYLQHPSHHAALLLHLYWLVATN